MDLFERVKTAGLKLLSMSHFIQLGTINDNSNVQFVKVIWLNIYQ